MNSGVRKFVPRSPVQSSLEQSEAVAGRIENLKL